ncbi:hypothetical protein GH975_02985 [Litorivicinus lipolyticus]|uniref:Uncharacterized protein n=1 Tax=Litorivicinus lipolyticus TaxID=418701 RepID=A0A5Q2QC74_9GAMM|nr:hypothetical protein [Litorivicinus lipolyticus]QGG79587.1 hypothetical protein GH975_02985 [Litorivicinus lipolyticus]
MKSRGLDIPDLRRSLDAMTPNELAAIIPLYERQLACAVTAKNVEKSLRVARILVELGGRRVSHLNQTAREQNSRIPSKR